MLPCASLPYFFCMCWQATSSFDMLTIEWQWKDQGWGNCCRGRIRAVLTAAASSSDVIIHTSDTVPRDLSLATAAVIAPIEPVTTLNPQLSGLCLLCLLCHCGDSPSAAFLDRALLAIRVIVSTSSLHAAAMGTQ